MTGSRIWGSLVLAGTAAAVGIAVHTAINLRSLRSPGSLRSPERPATPNPEPSPERVSILIPARNEAATIAQSIGSALAQQDVPALEVIVLNDGSQDATGAQADEIAQQDDRLRVLHAEDQAPPEGWLGKPWACQRLAQEADGSVLVFMDADVTLEPTAVAALVDDLRSRSLAMVAPYPAQVAEGWLERLVQPLVTWSWAATMPLAWAERSLRPSLSAANGQLIAVDRTAYEASGGHASVRGDVLEDIGLMRAFKRAGFHTATVDGSSLARCRMYSTTGEVVDGYSKSLWAAFNGPVGSAAVNGLLLLAYVVPALGMVAPDGRNRAVGAVGYAAGVTSRVLVARRTGDRLLPDVLAQPLSILAFVGLNALSWKRHLRGENRWKGRPVVTA